MKEYMISFIRVKGAKVSSALSAMRLEVALWQNACLNFCTLYSNEGLTCTSTETFTIPNGKEIG